MPRKPAPTGAPLAPRIYVGPGPHKGQTVQVERNGYSWLMRAEFPDGHFELVHRRRLKSLEKGA